MNLRSMLVIVLLIIALVLAAAAFVMPWQPPPSVGSPMMERYAPLKDGDAFLVLGRNSAGQPSSWTGRSVEILPTARVLAGEVSVSTRDAIQKYMRRGGESEIDPDTLPERLGSAVIYRQTDRTVDEGGQLIEIVTYAVRDARGEAVISSFFPSQNYEVVFDPPLLTMPATFEVGSVWESEGTAGSIPYSWKTRVVGRDEEKDCWTFESTIQLAVKTRTEIDYCAGKGVVASRAFDANDVPTEQAVVLNRDEPLPAGTLDALRQEQPAPAPALTGDFDAWTLTRLGRVGRNISAGEATIPPVWLPTSPPRVLASGYLGAFFAYDANDPAATALWSFPVAGTVYSAPVYDAQTGRIFFGASDKRLYALDARGMFLWSFLARDNIAARPLLAEGRVIFGSEDRSVYALNAQTGALDWRAEATSPIVSAAAFGNGKVIVGSDDGTVYAFDVETGDERWTFSADDAVQAPVVVKGETAFVSSRGGTVFALDVSNGTERWRAEPGAELNSAPLIADGRVYVVARNGVLTVLDAASGTILRRTSGTNFSGTPLLVQDALIVAGSDGNVYRLDREGSILQTWTSAEVSNTLDSFVQSPAVGGDAVWLIDSKAGLWRLGTPRAQLAALLPVWTVGINDAPLQQHGLFTSVAEYDGRAVLVDEGANVYLVDTQNGSTERVGQIVADSAKAPRLDSVVAGDALFTVIGQTLYVTNLQDGSLLWQAEGAAPSYRPVMVVDDMVLWTQLELDLTGTARVKGSVTALDRITGELRWQHLMEGSGYPTGVTARDGVVYTAEPAAYDLSTGEEVWRTTVDGWTAGEPTLSADGLVLYVPASETDIGMVLALDARDGRVLWQKPTSTNTPSFLEKISVSGEELIVSGLNGTVAALDGADGALRWTYEPPAPRLGTLNVQNGLVWMLLKNGRVIALDAATGEPAAQFSDLDVNLTTGVTPYPLVINGTVIVPLDSRLVGLGGAP